MNINEKAAYLKGLFDGYEIDGTTKEAKLIGELITEMIPVATSNLRASTLYALKNDAYFNSAFKAMPKAINLYAAAATALKDDGIYSLSGTKEENERALLLAILASEKEIRELDTALNAYAKADTARLKDSVELYAGAEDIASFKEKYEPISCDELIIAVNNALNNDTKDKENLNDLTVSYLSSISLYLSFVIFN